MANRAALKEAGEETEGNAIDREVDGRAAVADEPEEQENAGEDSRIIGGGNEDAEEQGEGEDGLSPEEIEARRKAIREKRKRKKEAQKARRGEERQELDHLRRQNSDLARRLSAVENRSVSADLATVDGKIADTKRYIESARGLYKQALASEDPEERAKAAEIEEALYRGRRTLDMLTNYKERAENTAAAPGPTDGVVRDLATDWAAKNKWYDPSGGDRDSRLMAQLDRELAAEMDPADPRYWSKLTELGRKYLPHRYKDDAEDDAEDGDERSDEIEEETPRRRPLNGRRQGNPPPMGGSGDDGDGAPREGEYRLSPHRREALRDAGVEPGTKEWKRMIGKYKQYDAQAKGAT